MQGPCFLCRRFVASPHMNIDLLARRRSKALALSLSPARSCFLAVLRLDRLPRSRCDPAAASTLTARSAGSITFDAGACHATRGFRAARSCSCMPLLGLARLRRSARLTRAAFPRCCPVRARPDRRVGGSHWCSGARDNTPWYPGVASLRSPVSDGRPTGGGISAPADCRACGRRDRGCAAACCACLGPARPRPTGDAMPAMVVALAAVLAVAAARRFAGRRFAAGRQLRRAAHRHPRHRLAAQRPARTSTGRGRRRPASDAFSRSAHRFQDATTPLARTYPSWMSILTGRHPVSDQCPLQPDAATLVHEGETLADALKRDRLSRDLRDG